MEHSDNEFVEEEDKVTDDEGSEDGDSNGDDNDDGDGEMIWMIRTVQHHAS